MAVVSFFVFSFSACISRFPSTLFSYANAGFAIKKEPSNENLHSHHPPLTHYPQEQSSPHTVPSPSLPPPSPGIFGADFDTHVTYPLHPLCQSSPPVMLPYFTPYPSIPPTPTSTATSTSHFPATSSSFFQPPFDSGYSPPLTRSRSLPTSHSSIYYPLYANTMQHTANTYNTKTEANIEPPTNIHISYKIKQESEYYRERPKDESDIENSIINHNIIHDYYQNDTPPSTTTQISNTTISNNDNDNDNDNDNYNNDYYCNNNNDNNNIVEEKKEHEFTRMVSESTWEKYRSAVDRGIVDKLTRIS